MRENEFDFIRGLVYEHSRINLGPDKRELMAARLGKRLLANNLSTVGDYCELLQTYDDGEELAHLIDAISTNHTFFFREKSHFDFLTGHVVPEMTGRARPEHWARFNVWSAACSSGEEPYSAAMVLAETLGKSWAWHIEATDISHHIVEKAGDGIYRKSTMAKVDSLRLRQHFQRGFGPQQDNYRIRSNLKAAVTFQQLNLLGSELPFTKLFHVIFCRNVMIYFDRATQEELVQKLSQSIVPGGYLFVGHSESLAGIRHSLQPVKPAIYRRPPSL